MGQTRFDKQALDQKVAEALPFHHPWHNHFHLEMPFGLINDPNGLVCHDGLTHIFFQWNPFGTEHANKCWAHVQTRDFVHYTMPELSLWPSDEHDQDGCYSGSGFVEDDAVRVVYTCNAKNEAGERRSSQRLGTLMPDGSLRKDKLIIPAPAPGFTAHFRDPYLFYRNGDRYLLLGAQREDQTGTVVVYAEQGGEWKFLGELQTSGGSSFGYMWECPNLLTFGRYDVLLFCPQGIPAKAYRYQNRYQSGYLVGHLSLSSMEFMSGHFHELDKGFDFYAPQVLNKDGRHILFGWVGMPDPEPGEYPTAKEGWVHSLTLPRVLSLRQGKLYQDPLPELERLRVEAEAEDLDANETKAISVKLSKTAELVLDITPGQASVITCALYYGVEHLDFQYVRRSQVMTIDRTGMKLGGRGTRKFKLYSDQNLALHIFVDRTVIETFFQHGEETATTNVFPEKDIAPELRIYADRPMRRVSGRAWALADCSCSLA